MRRFVVAGWVVAMTSLQVLFAQSIVFVSPSTKGLQTMSCAAGSLGSFEQLHYLATAHYLTATLCPQGQIESIVGVWRGHAENSGMIDGCPLDRARDLGALLARYYHQKQALIFDRNAAGKTSLVSFRAIQPLAAVAHAMAQARVNGASVIPHMHDNLILIVSIDAAERAHALALYSLLHGQGFHEETGTAELIGDYDRAKARDIFTAIVAEAPSDVQQLSEKMYSEQFHELGIRDLRDATPAH